MKLINQSVALVTNNNPLKLVELAGRVSHKSEDKITDDSYKKFLIDMLGLGHTATLEFGDVYIHVDNPARFLEYYDTYKLIVSDNPAIHVYAGSCYNIYTNFRFLLDRCPELFVDYINNEMEYAWAFVPEKDDPYKRYCFDIVTNRGVSHELVRHRIFSFLQESTRYCNYSKDKFSNELNVINPFRGFIKSDRITEEEYHSQLCSVESSYNFLTNNNDHTQLKAQEARGILPNDLKTELYMSGFLKDWVGHDKDVYAMDLFGETVTCKEIKGFDTLRNNKSAHPQAREIAELIKEELLIQIGNTAFKKIKDTYYE